MLLGETILSIQILALLKEPSSNKIRPIPSFATTSDYHGRKPRLDGQVAELNTAKNSIASQGSIPILKNATDIKSNKTELTSQGARLTTVEQVATDATGSIATLSQRIGGCEW